MHEPTAPSGPGRFWGGVVPPNDLHLVRELVVRSANVTWTCAQARIGSTRRGATMTHAHCLPLTVPLRTISGPPELSWIAQSSLTKAAPAPPLPVQPMTARAVPSSDGDITA